MRKQYETMAQENWPLLWQSLVPVDHPAQSRSEDAPAPPGPRQLAQSSRHGMAQLKQQGQGPLLDRYPMNRLGAAELLQVQLS